MNICALCWTMMLTVPDSSRFQAFAQAKIPDEIVSALVGQLTALEKPNGGVRGIVVGDLIRRLVAKTMSHKAVSICIVHQSRV